MKRLWVAGFLMCVVIVSIFLNEKKYIHTNDKVEFEYIGRFEILENFHMFDGDKYGPKGKIIRNKKTDKCFLYIWGGSASGGPAITAIECELTTTEDL